MSESLDTILFESHQLVLGLGRHDPPVGLYKPLVQIMAQCQKLGSDGFCDRQTQAFVASHGLDFFGHEQLLDQTLAKEEKTQVVSHSKSETRSSQLDSQTCGIVQRHQDKQVEEIESRLTCRAMESLKDKKRHVRTMAEESFSLECESQVSDIVGKLNQCRRQNMGFALVENLQGVFRYNKLMALVLNLMRSVSLEEALISSGENIVQARKQNQLDAGTTKSRLVERTRMFLEKEFVRFAENVVVQFPREARLGGRPSVAEKIRAFINVKFSGMDTKLFEVVNKVLIWVNLFYLYRSGDLGAMQEFIRANQSLFYRIDRNLLCSIQDHQNNRCLSTALQSAMAEEYLSMTRDPKTDPFKLVLYESLCRIEPADNQHHELVLVTVEDWIWYRLNLVKPNGVGLDIFQASVVELGEEYFSQSGDVFQYSKVLFECCLYEQALYHIFQKGLLLESVCLAIILAYYGLLSPMETSDDNFVANKISFLEIMDEYVSNRIGFESHPTADYILCLSLIDTPEYQTYTIDRLKGWILNTKRFYELGKLDEFSTLVSLEASVTSRTSCSISARVAREAAAECQASDYKEDAIQLYHMAGEYTRALDLSCRQLSSFLDEGTQSAREFVDQSRTLLARYKTDVDVLQTSGTEVKLKTLQCLLDIVDLYVLHEAKKWELVLCRIEECGLFNCSNVQTTLRFWKEADFVVAKRLPRLIRMFVESVQGLHKSATYQGELKRAMKFVILFSGQLELPADVNILVAQVDSQLA